MQIHVKHDECYTCEIKLMFLQVTMYTMSYFSEVQGSTTQDFKETETNTTFLTRGPHTPETST